MTVIKLIYAKLTFASQFFFLENSYSKFHESPADGLVSVRYHIGHSHFTL
jgi:hypothetical protein